MEKWCACGHSKAEHTRVSLTSPQQCFHYEKCNCPGFLDIDTSIEKAEKVEHVIGDLTRCSWQDCPNPPTVPVTLEAFSADGTLCVAHRMTCEKHAP